MTRTAFLIESCNTWMTDEAMPYGNMLWHQEQAAPSKLSPSAYLTLLLNENNFRTTDQLSLLHGFQCYNQRHSGSICQNLSILSMMTEHQAGIDNTPGSRTVPFRVRSRPVSTTLIPRPVSNTSYQTIVPLQKSALSPEILATPKTLSEKSISPLLSPVYARRISHVPNSSIERHASPDTRTQNANIHVQKHRRQQQSVGCNVTTPAASVNSCATLSLDLSKPTTHGFLSSSTQDVSPRRLLHPISPPLPRSHTLANVSCFTTHIEHSPLRSRRNISLSGQIVDIKQSSGNAHGNLQENCTYYRATKGPKNTRLHAARNDHTHKSSNTASKVASISPTAPNSTQSRANSPITDATSTSLVNTNVNVSELKTFKKTSGRDRILHINTTLANTLKEKVGSAFSTPKSTATSNSTLISTDSSLVSRNVYSAEDVPYWTGRYMATYDRLRQADCKALLGDKKPHQPLNISSTVFESTYDKLENSRQKRALRELNSYCKNKLAAKSLAKFEAGLLNPSLIRAIPRFVRSTSEQFWRRDLNSNAKVSMEPAQPEDSTFVKQSIDQPTSHVTALRVLAGDDRVSTTVGQTRLPKSKTTSNLGDLREPVPSPSGVAKTMQPSQNFSYKQPINDHDKSRLASPHPSHSLSRVLKQRSRRTTSSPSSHPSDDSYVTVTHRRQSRSGNNLDRITSLKRPRVTVTALPEPCTIPTNVGRLPSTLPVVRRLDAMISNNENIEQADHVPEDQADGPVVPLRRPSGGGQMSTEFFKKIVGASAREVKKMGRRVGSMGWGSSYEDLRIPGRYDQ